MTDEKFKIPVIRKRSDLEKVAKGDVVEFSVAYTKDIIFSYFGILLYKGEKSFALVELVESGEKHLVISGDVTWRLYEVGDEIKPRGYHRYPFKVGSEEYENYKSRLTKLRELRDSDKLDFVEF